MLKDRLRREVKKKKKKHPEFQIVWTMLLCNVKSLKAQGDQLEEECG